nr:MAG TPA: DNA N-6-adenine-methyltransferase [Caudoviricetes sp.]
MQVSKSKTYEEFVEKFKPKKTTDDCYTPPTVYDALADWVADKYGVPRDDFVRPFYPGGDYQSEDYTNKIVVDNPPFSILAQIVDFYIKNGVKFFLFAPTLTSLRYYTKGATLLVAGTTIVYENGASVNTSFVTNLEREKIAMKSEPTLYRLLVDVQKKEKKVSKQLPKYAYPPEVLTTAQLYLFSKYGVDFSVRREECIQISALDSQRPAGKTIFGSGVLLSATATAEREKAEREKAVCWTISDREREMIAALKREG